MGLPFSKLIQNGQEYNVAFPKASEYQITSNTRLGDIQPLIENSINKGFIPYIINKTGNNDYVQLQLESHYHNNSATFTCVSAGHYGSISGVIEDAIIVNKLSISTSAISYDGYGVNKSASIHNTLSISEITLYYK